MHRRRFLASLPAAGLAASAAAAPSPASPPDKIKSLEFIRLEGSSKGVAGINRQHQVRPADVYDDLRPKPYHESGEGRETTQRRSALYLKIALDSGLEGVYGPIDREAASVVDQQLKEFLIGKDGLAVERIWDQLHRMNRHSRSSHYMMAISAIDCTLWDLRGRHFGAPVYRLLGGPTRDPVTVYGSCLGYSVEPELAGRKAAELKQQGFLHQKWFLAYGPGDGAKGLDLNVELVRSLRAAVGNDVDLMFDAFMGWDLNYAVAWAKQVEQYRPRWIEEAFHVDKLESFVKLRQQTSVPVATGEHFYGRWEVMRFLHEGAISVVQADPEWCGGVSELVKICNIASAYDAHVIPHGHSVHAAMHVVASQSPMTCPLVEYLINKMQTYYYFEKDAPAVLDGKIHLSNRPGFGIEFDQSKIEKQSVVRWGETA